MQNKNHTWYLKFYHVLRISNLIRDITKKSYRRPDHNCLETYAQFSEKK